MAGDWIAMRLDLYEDPAVAFMAERLGEREEVIVGFLHRVWSWASRQCHGGRVTNVTLASLGRVTSLQGFPDLMVESGWLEHGTDGNGKPYVEFPNWDRWMAESAKKRLLAAKRQSKKRHADVTDSSRCERDKSVTTGEESTEEKKEEDKGESDKSDPPADKPSDGEIVLAEWNRQMGQACRWTKKRQTAFRERWKSQAWRESWLMAVGRAAASRFCRGENDRAWLADFEWFLKPDTVTKLLEGKYDDRQPKQNGKTWGQQRQQNTMDLLAKLQADEAAAAAGGVSGFIRQVAGGGQ